MLRVRQEEFGFNLDSVFAKPWRQLVHEVERHPFIATATAVAVAVPVALSVMAEPSAVTPPEPFNPETAAYTPSPTSTEEASPAVAVPPSAVSAGPTLATVQSLYPTQVETQVPSTVAPPVVEIKTIEPSPVTLLPETNPDVGIWTGSTEMPGYAPSNPDVHGVWTGSGEMPSNYPAAAYSPEGYTPSIPSIPAVDNSMSNSLEKLISAVTSAAIKKIMPTTTQPQQGGIYMTNPYQTIYLDGKSAGTIGGGGGGGGGTGADQTPADSVNVGGYVVPKNYLYIAGAVLGVVLLMQMMK